MTRSARLLLIACVSLFTSVASADPAVRTMRVPNDGLQPQVAVDDAGKVHLIYFKNDASHGDVFYVHSTDGGKSFSRPMRVNSVDGSAIATGTIRGAHLAIGRDRRVHVAWNGSDVVTLKGAGKVVPMYYARLNDAGNAFEPQRNVIDRHFGLDGGGSVAADKDGNVYVAWHAPEQKGQDEGSRGIWIARSSDDGKTFAPETRAFAEPTGACGCCGMRLFADLRGSVYALYRSANEMVNRDMYLLRSDDHAKSFQGTKVAPMKIGMCVMSSEAMAQAPDGIVAAWETNSQIFWSHVAPKGPKISEATPAPGEPRGRKHPALATNARGDVLLVWTEGTGWNKGGSIAWQVYDASGKPIAGASGKQDGLPAWSLPTAFAEREGAFTILY